MSRSDSRPWRFTALVFCGLALAMLSTTACQRRGYTPLPSDSTSAASDSSGLEMRDAQSAWDGGDPKHAAELSARVLYRDLHPLPPTEWAARAEALLDSLGIGAELVRGPCALVANFFSRSDPSAGSWPYVYACGEKGPVYEHLEGGGMKLTAVTTRYLAPDAKPSPDHKPVLAVLFSRSARGGQQPLLMTWEAAKGGWKLVQTLGPDSLGTYGSGEFEVPDDTTMALVTRTYRTPPSFDECATCPHVFTVGRFVWRPAGFVRVDQRYVPSPYSSFVRLVRALGANDREAALALVATPEVLAEAERLEWNRPKGSWRVSPGTEETPGRLTIFRGTLEAYRVEFSLPTDGDWVIAQIVPVPRAVE